MMSDLSHDHAAEHLAEARHKARQILSGETHLGAMDDWGRIIVSARDAVILIWLTWVALHGFGDPPFAGQMLVAMAVSLALLVGISTGRSTLAQVQYYASEFERERDEIRDHFDHEREEVVALYQAKGLTGTLLEEVVDTLCSDDDRLLKLMMEEELGLSMHHVQHPFVVGAVNGAAALAAGLTLALPVLWMASGAVFLWMIIGGLAIMGLLAIASVRATTRSGLEFFMAGVVTAVVTGGVVYFLAQWFSRPGGVGST